MPWCHLEIVHYLYQCWPICMIPYGISRPQWVNGFIEYLIKLWAALCHWRAMMTVNACLHRAMKWQQLDYYYYWIPHKTMSSIVQLKGYHWPICMIPYGISRPRWVNGFIEYLIKLWAALCNWTAVKPCLHRAMKWQQLDDWLLTPPLWLVMKLTTMRSVPINTLRPRQNGRHFPDDIFRCIFVNENVWSSIKISLKFVLKGPINNIPALVQIMAWRRPGDKPMIVSLLTHICVTRPQWVNIFMPLNER